MTNTAKSIIFAIVAFSPLMSVTAESKPILPIIDHGYYTTDVNTKLEWLDVSITSGLSYNAVMSRTEEGGDLSGWRYATIDELTELLGNWGWFTGPATSTVNFHNAWFDNLDSNLSLEIVKTLGGTEGQQDSFGSIVHGVNGLLADDTHVGSGYKYFASLISVSPGGPNTDSYREAYAWSETDLGLNHIGSFLVRSTNVPEPSSLALISIGLAGFWFSRNRPSSHS